MAYEWLEYCNNKKLKERGDYGVRLARPGFDASNCADNQLIFNSGWPILQLCAVIDFDKSDDVYTRYLLPDRTWSDTLPSGYNLVSTITNDTRWGKFGVNDKKCRMYVSTKTYMNSSYSMVEAITYKRMKHYLNYVPFFLPADELTGTNTNKLLLFSVDIGTDVDYPYTDMALPLVGVPNDCGMKCESVFGPKVPGLSAGQFSKLVQAVKTQDTAKYNIRSVSGSGDGYLSFWSPLDGVPETAPTKAPILPYEAFSFAVTGIADYNNTAVYDETDGGYYVEVGVRGLDNAGDKKPYAYSNIAHYPPNYKKESLVVLRSPLVTPEYEEISG